MMWCILQSNCLQRIVRKMPRGKDLLGHFLKRDFGPLHVETKKLADET